MLNNLAINGKTGKALQPPWAWALVILLLPLLYWEFCPDDFYIYLNFARNLAQNNEMAFNPGQRAYGFTSPLWLGFLGLCHLTSLPILLSKLICWFFFAMALWRFHALLRRQFSDNLTAWAGVTLLAANPWMLRWALSGLETSAALLVTVLAFELFLDRRRGACLAIGLLPLLRPELLIWTLAFAVYSLARNRWRQALLSLLPASLWHGFSLFYFGQVFPNTAYAKSTGLAAAAAFSAAKKIVMALPPLEALALGITAILLVFQQRRRSRAWPAMIPVALLLALFVIRGVNVHTRYLVPVFPLTVYLLLLLLEKNKKKLLAVLFTAMAIGLFQSLLWIYPATQSYIRSEKKVNIAIGQYLRQAMAPDETVFLWDIGAISYYARRPIIDLNGIVDRRISKRHNDFRQVIAGHLRQYRRRAFFVDIHPDRLNFQHRPLAGVRARFLFSLPFHKMFIMQKEPLYYSVYELSLAQQR